VHEALVAAAERPPPSFDAASQGWALIALQNAFYQLLHAPTLEDGVVATVMQGGDTDTTAAIAGALLGAVHGRDAAPARWRRAVLTSRPIAGLDGVLRPRPRPFWPVDLMEMAELLLAAGYVVATT
jgi:ADP-ribosylglycohydrolase